MTHEATSGEDDPARAGALTDTSRLSILLLGVLVIMIDGFDLQAIGFVAPEIARDWSLPLAAFGPVFSAALAGSMLGALAAGYGARHIGLRSSLSGVLILFGGCTLAAAQVEHIATLAGLRLAAGVGLGAAVPLAMTVVASHSRARWRATVVVITLCGQPIGAILGAALCARFIPVLGWRFAFYLGGILPLLLVVAVVSAPVTSAPCNGPKEERGGRLREIFRRDRWTTSVTLGLCVFLSSFFIYIIINWLPGFVRAIGYSLGGSLAAISLFNSGGIAGAVLAGVLIDRHGPFKVVPVFFAVGALSMATLDAARAVPALLYSASFASGFGGYGGAVSLGSLMIILYPPALRAMISGWALGVGRLGAAVGPLGAGFALAAGLGVGRLFYAAAGASLLVMLSLIILGRLRESQGGGPMPDGSQAQ